MFISVTWHEQHLIFSHIRRCSTGFLLINLSQLGAVSLVPFGSAMLGDFPESPEAAIVFSAIMLLNAGCMAANAFYVSRHGDLLEGAGREGLMRRAVLHLSCGLSTAAAAAVTAYFHDPLVGGFVWMLTPICILMFHTRTHVAQRPATIDGADASPIDA